MVEFQKLKLEDEGGVPAIRSTRTRVPGVFPGLLEIGKSEPNSLSRAMRVRLARQAVLEPASHLLQEDHLEE